MASINLHSIEFVQNHSARNAKLLTSPSKYCLPGHGLDNWPVVNMTSAEDIVDNAQKNHTDGTYRAKVHGLHRDFAVCGPHAEEDGDQGVDDSKDIDQDSPDTWNAKGAPDQLGSDCVDDLVSASRQRDGTGQTSPEEKDGDHDVREVQTGNRHGAEVVEGDGRSNGDQGQQNRHNGGECDRPDRNGGSRRDLDED
jgi:hypothetical protein